MIKINLTLNPSVTPKNSRLLPTLFLRLNLSPHKNYCNKYKFFFRIYNFSDFLFEIKFAPQSSLLKIFEFPLYLGGLKLTLR